MNRTMRTLLVATATVASLLAGTTSQAAPTRPSAAADEVRVATYNILKVSGSNAKGRWAWSHRRNALVRSVEATRPDVLAVQEANTQIWHGVRHIDDVRRLLAPLGMQITSTDYDGCTPGCTRGAHLFFRTSRMKLATLPSGMAPAGMEALSVIARTGFGGIQDRNASWAFLTPTGSSRTTLYVSVHLPTQKNAHGEHLRRAVAARLKPWAVGLLNRSGLRSAELVIAGDLNSFQRRQPAGAQQILTDAGLIDGFRAPVRANEHYSTVNYTPQTRKYKGFPPRPYYYRSPTTRIDYVFSSVTPRRHEVVLFRTASGRFDNRYRVSDHNMVLVDLPLR